MRLGEACIVLGSAPRHRALTTRSPRAHHALTTRSPRAIVSRPVLAANARTANPREERLRAERLRDANPRAERLRDACRGEV
jgi:hypothetical protein